MFAGASLPFWVGFHAIVVVLLLVDVFVLDRKSRPLSFRVALLWTLFLVALAMGFAALLSSIQGHRQALAFVSGYLIEASLSVDNLFVFVLLFRSFGLSDLEQRKALHWGVLGAIVLRAAFIFAGIALLHRFASVQYLFGALLLYAAWRVLRSDENKSAPSLLRHLHLGKRSPLLLAIVAIELTDLIFAIDSIPAVLAITRDTFVVYTSNIFAILGLRSVYFLLSGLLDRLHLLHYGLGIILAFVALKMLLAQVIEIPIWVSLAVILGTIALFGALSVLRPKRAKSAGQPAG